MAPSTAAYAGIRALFFPQMSTLFSLRKVAREIFAGSAQGQEEKASKLLLSKAPCVVNGAVSPPCDVEGTAVCTIDHMRIVATGHRKREKNKMLEPFSAHSTLPRPRDLVFPGTTTKHASGVQCGPRSHEPPTRDDDSCAALTVTGKKTSFIRFGPKTKQKKKNGCIISYISIKTLERRIFRSSVVFPAPRDPVTMVTGSTGRCRVASYWRFSYMRYRLVSDAASIAARTPGG